MKMEGGILQIFGSRLIVAILYRWLYANIQGHFCKTQNQDLPSVLCHGLPERRRLTSAVAWAPLLPLASFAEALECVEQSVCGAPSDDGSAFELTGNAASGLWIDASCGSPERRRTPAVPRFSNCLCRVRFQTGTLRGPRPSITS
jgi:hypothetical protein